jgi:hypothetical protein
MSPGMTSTINKLSFSTGLDGWLNRRVSTAATAKKATKSQRKLRKNTEYTRDPRVDAYIASLPQWQQDICGRARDLVHAADPEMVETIKRTKLPYFVLQGNVCALLAAKDHVNVFIYDGGIAPDPEGIITGGHHNKTARVIAIRETDTVKARALTAIIKHIVADNRAGGWRRLKARATRA